MHADTGLHCLHMPRRRFLHILFQPVIHVGASLLQGFSYMEKFDSPQASTLNQLCTTVFK